MDEQNKNEFGLEPPVRHNLANDENLEKEELKKPKKAKKQKSKKTSKKVDVKKVVCIVIACILGAVIIATGTISIVNKQSPVATVKSAFVSNKKEIVGIWQSESLPGTIAYVFQDDGTYSYYISNVNIGGTYEIKGSKITMSKTGSSLSVTYKFKITGDKLSFTTVEDGKASKDDTDTTTYEKTDELNQKSLTDLISNYATKNKEESTTK